MTRTDLNEAASPADEVRALYTDLALHPERDFGWGTGKTNARRLGYDARWLERLPEVAWQSAAAVGNPFALGALSVGETVLDLGCGAGVDLCIAALSVGATGRVIGVDVTPAMIAKARAIADLLGLTRIELYVADMQVLPLGDATADVVLSNGAINLSAHKPCVFKEIFRVLKPGGRVQFADMVRESRHQNPAVGSWADCVSGTVEPQRYLELLDTAGFREAEMVSFTGYRTAASTMGATFRARKP